MGTSRVHSLLIHTKTGEITLIMPRFGDFPSVYRDINSFSE